MKDKKKAAEDLFYRIGYGRESRVERPRNRAVDRSLRRMIGEWNEHSDNDTIINVGDGYYKPRLSVPDEKLECKQYIAQETARAYRVLDKSNLCGRHLKGWISMVNGKKKGKAGELEVARILRSYGYPCRRGQQYSGANGDADVVGLPGIHIEVKRRENLNVYEAIEQAKRDAAKIGTMPTVMWRKNDHEWLVTMPMEAWMQLYQKAGL